MIYDFESEAAAPRGKQNVEDHSKTVTQTVLHAQANKDNERQRKWFDSGVRAKQRGYGNFSPFYENKTADYFFKCGYAGTSFEQAQETLRSEIEQILKQDSTLSESVNELVADNNESKATDFLP